MTSVSVNAGIYFKCLSNAAASHITMIAHTTH